MVTKTRIYICGSHSVGKTTLCRELSKQLDYEVIEEAARAIIAEQKINFDAIACDIYAKDTFQSDVVARHIHNHLQAIKALEDGQAKGFIFDRGLDFLVYSAEFSTMAGSQFRWPDIQNYIKTLRHKQALVVLLEPHEKLIKNDGVRASLDILTAHKITFGIKCLLEVLDIPYVYLTNPNVLERVKLIQTLYQV